MRGRQEAISNSDFLLSIFPRWVAVRTLRVDVNNTRRQTNMTRQVDALDL